jgi:esterase/lipase
MIAALLLHGFATDITDYSSIIPFLKKRYDAIFLDSLPGHGLNVNLSDFTVNNVMEYLNKKFDEIKSKYEYVDVYGYSMGGVLATYLGVKKEVNRIILLAPANKYINARIFATRLKKEFSLLSNKDWDRAKLIQENDKRGMNVVINDLMPRYNVHTISTFISLVRYCNNELVENNVKTIIIKGDQDEFVPDTSSKFIKKYYKNVEEVIIPDLGHLMLKSKNYRLIINAIKDFLDE